MSTEKEVLEYFTTKIFNVTPDELTDVIYDKDEEGNLSLKENAADLLAERDSQRITRIKGQSDEDFKKKIEESYSKGKREAMQVFEEEFKARTGIKSDKKGIDLILEWGNSQKQQKAITDDEVKLHPTFIEREKQLIDEWEKKYEEKSQEFEQYKADIENNRVFSTIKAKAEEVLLTLNPVLSPDPVKAKRQTENFLNSLTTYSYEVNDGNIIIKKDGKRLEDGHSNLINFSTFVHDMAENWGFDFQVQGQKGNAGNRGGGTSGNGVPLAKDKEELNRMINEAYADGNEELAIELHKKFHEK